MKVTLIIGAIAYLVGAYVCAGAELAYWQRKYSSISSDYYRQDLLVAWLMSLNPVAWILIVFHSGFLEYGWMNPIGRKPKIPIEGERG